MKRIILNRIAPAFAALLWLNAGSAFAADKVTFNLSFVPQGANANVYYAAHKGLFAAENIEVTILTGRGAADTMTKIATGIADIGEVTFDVLLAANADQPVPVKAVMAEFTRPPDVLITTTTSGINSLKDAVGRKVATSPYTSSNLSWPVVLRHNGIDPASITLTKADPQTLPGLLATGQTEAIIGWATTAPKPAEVLAAVGKTIKIIPWTGYDGYSQSLVASNKFIAEHPDVLKRFLKVMKKSLQIVYENPQAGAEAIKAMVPQADVKTLVLQIEAARPFFINETSQRTGLGVFAPDLVKKTWDWVAKANNYAPNKLDPMSIIDARFIQ
jgi:NitT/TauT family transport system substrate-binding protein